eukprot:520298-Prymnesium_polylepis.1
MLADAGAAALFAEVTPPAVLADAGAAALFAEVTPPAVLADVPPDPRRRSTRLHPPSARRSHHGRSQLLVGVGGVVARLR